MKRLMNGHDIHREFIKPTLLGQDHKGWWLFKWPESKWKSWHIMKRLEETGCAKVTAKYRDGRPMEIWLLKPVTPKEVEFMCLGDSGIERVRKI